MRDRDSDPSSHHLLLLRVLRGSKGIFLETWKLQVPQALRSAASGITPTTHAP